MLLAMVHRLTRVMHWARCGLDLFMASHALPAVLPTAYLPVRYKCMHRSGLVLLLMARTRGADAWLGLATIVASAASSLLAWMRRVGQLELLPGGCCCCCCSWCWCWPRGLAWLLSSSCVCWCPAACCWQGDCQAAQRPVAGDLCTRCVQGGEMMEEDGEGLV